MRYGYISEECNFYNCISYLYFQPIDYEGFRLFMETYLEADIGEELCKHLFLSFIKKSSGLPNPSQGNKEFGVKDVAFTASQTVCAPITHQSTEIHVDRQEKHGLAEKIHGITEKLHSLGHSGDKGKNTVKFLNFWKPIIFEPRSEKTGLRGFRPGPTQTRLYSHTRWLEA